MVTYGLSTRLLESSVWPRAESELERMRSSGGVLHPLFLRVGQTAPCSWTTITHFGAQVHTPPGRGLYNLTGFPGKQEHRITL